MSKHNDIYVDCNFPGGNIVVEDIAGTDVRVHQDLRDTDYDTTELG